MNQISPFEFETLKAGSHEVTSTQPLTTLKKRYFHLGVPWKRKKHVSNHEDHSPPEGASWRRSRFFPTHHHLGSPGSPLTVLLVTHRVAHSWASWAGSKVKSFHVFLGYKMLGPNLIDKIIHPPKKKHVLEKKIATWPKTLKLKSRSFKRKSVTQILSWSLYGCVCWWISPSIGWALSLSCWRPISPFSISIVLQRLKIVGCLFFKRLQLLHLHIAKP